MKKEKYNWWTDPKNANDVKKISWWEHEDNKTTIELPVSIVFDGKWYVIAGNEETKKLIGENLCQCAQGETREEVVKQFFAMMKLMYEFSNERERKFQKWIPFSKGDWKHKGGKWFTIYGVQFYFRYGRGMKFGWYIPFTKLNISISNYWKR